MKVHCAKLRQDVKKEHQSCCPKEILNDYKIKSVPPNTGRRVNIEILNH